MLIQLRHRRILALPAARDLPRIPAHLLNDADRGGRLVLSFRMPEHGKPQKILSNVSAVTQLNDLAAQHILCWGLQSDCPYAGVLIWDIAHHLPIGGSLAFGGELNDRHVVLRDYYASAFSITKKADGVTVFTKTTPLSAELSGIDDWTFGIPASPDDATLLNACVRRILALDVPRKEIILCGRPGANFLYWDQVRIVGEDIPAPPLRITLKKNRIAQEARYENLCILHDRVMLPRDFYAAVKAFGRCYPFTAFQSLYFDDRWNLIPRRYSDAGVGKQIDTKVNYGLMRDQSRSPSKFGAVVFGQLEKSDFVFCNPHRTGLGSYPTGSLYMVKRSLWLRCPQNESLNWMEFEDIEHAERASAMGIPTRINPHAFTQSMMSRPLLAPKGVSTIELPNGQGGKYRAFTERLSFLPRKPLIKKTEAQAIQDAEIFASRYTARLTVETLTGSAMRHRYRLRMMTELVRSVRLPLQKSALQKFVFDFEKLLAGDHLPYMFRDHLVEQLYLNGPGAIDILLGQNFQLHNHIWQRPRKYVYARSIKDYLLRDSLLLRLGSFISAVALGLQNHRAFYFPRGVWWRYRQIMDTTPLTSPDTEAM